MMTYKKTVDIPADHRLRFDWQLPPAMTRGASRVEVTVTPVVDGAKKPVENWNQETLDAHIFAPFPTLEELKAEAARKTEEQQAYFEATGKDQLVELRDSMKGMPFAGIDGVEYQRNMRDEWTN